MQLLNIIYSLSALFPFNCNALRHCKREAIQYALMYTGSFIFSNILALHNMSYRVSNPPSCCSAWRCHFFNLVSAFDRGNFSMNSLPAGAFVGTFRLLRDPGTQEQNDNVEGLEVDLPLPQWRYCINNSVPRWKHMPSTASHAA